MNFKKGSVYKHMRCVDVAFLVLDIIEDKDILKLNGWWISVVNKSNPFPMCQDNIEILKSNVYDWVLREDLDKKLNFRN